METIDLYGANAGAQEETQQIVETDLKELHETLRIDRRVFIEFFLGEELEFPVPDFHVEILTSLTSLNILRVLLAIPRGHAKTTLAKLAIVWYWLYSPYKFCIYVSNTSPIAKNACEDIMGFLQTPNFEATFGKINIIKSSASEGLWIFQLLTPDGKLKRCTLRSAGAGQQMRGINIDNKRPEVAVIDDLEDIENTKSADRQTTLDKWVLGTFIKALAHRNKIMWLGNILTGTSLLYRLSSRPKWNPVVYGCLVRNAEGKTVPLWPDIWSLEAIQEDLQEYKELGYIDVWFCEMMNMPGQGSNGFTASQINYMPAPFVDDLEGAFLTIDPAYGLNAKIHDASCVAAHAIPTGQIPIIVETDTGRFREHELFEAAFAMAKRWNAWTWGIEATAAQQPLLTLFDLYKRTKGEAGAMIEIIPLSHGGRAKSARVSTFISAMESKHYALYDQDMDATTQILSYNITLKDQADDVIDCCAYGLDMIEQHLGTILAQYEIAMNLVVAVHKPKYGTEICNV